jgi:hypothetical protein
MKLAEKVGIIACAGLLSLAVIGSARYARAQDADSPDGGAAHAAAVGTQPEKVQNFNGCWDGSSVNGTMEDQNFGSGYGWIWIAQNGSTIKSGHQGSYYEFVWDGGNDWAYGPIKGKATKNGFTASGKIQGGCKVKIIGHFGTDDDIVGTYHYSGCSQKKNDFINTSGTFDFPLNNSGCTDIIP